MNSLPQSHLFAGSKRFAHTMRFVAAFVTAVLFISQPCRAVSAYRSNKAGNALYADQKYDEAFKKYSEAQTARPDLSELKYNEANALYKLAKQKEAAKLFREAFAIPDPRKREWATYNLGNSFMQAGDLETAIDAYVRALHLNPDDRQAKINLELALRQKQEQEKEQQKPPPPDKKPPDKQKDEPPPPPQQDMDQKQMNSMLDYLKEKEREDMKKLKSKKRSVSVSGKDW